VNPILLTLNPLSLTPSRLPRFSANEGRPFPHAFPRQKGKNRGESNISEIEFSDFPPSRFSSIFKKGKKTGVVACGAQNFFANAIRTGKRATKKMTVKLEKVLAV
jgi:hypothetical protein